MPEKELGLWHALADAWEFITLFVGAVMALWMQAWTKINGKASRAELAATQAELYAHIDENLRLQRMEVEENIRSHREGMMQAQQEGRDDLLRAQSRLYEHLDDHLDKMRRAIDAQYAASTEERRKDREYLNTLYIQHVSTTNRRKEDGEGP